MNKSTHEERLKKAKNNHTDIMDISFRMYNAEEADFNQLMELIRTVYNDQLTLINLINKYENGEKTK